jgi:hypothetical protein
MKTLLICHDEAELDRVVLARWLNSFSNLVGIVSIHEPRTRMWTRSRRELKRIGMLRFFDVLAFRIFYSLFVSSSDRTWERQELQKQCATYAEIPAGTPILRVASPNSDEAEKFIRRLAPDITIARCKVILKEKIFLIPTRGTFVMHPGVCPEYRNAHGCFWALANGDTEKVGMTLLRIDKGVDTGPPFGYYTYRFDEARESHYMIQNKVVLQNLDALRRKLLDIFAGTATPIDVSGRASAAWGQPWLSKYLQWKARARRSVR